MQFHHSEINLAAGLDNAMGRPWWNGEASRQTVSQPIFSTFDLSWLARPSWIPMFAGWGTLVVEIGYVFFMWPRRTRNVWFIATLGLHLGIGLFMGLVFFSSVMILLTVCFFLIPEAIPERAVAGGGHGRSRQRSSWSWAGRRRSPRRTAKRGFPTISRPSFAV